MCSRRFRTNLRTDEKRKDNNGRASYRREKLVIAREPRVLQRLIEAGAMKVLKDTGELRLEGKEYVVRDGDVCHFRFNVG